MDSAMDHEAFEQMKDIMGEVLDDLIRTFLDYMPEQIEALQLALQERNAEQVFAVAHRIKSSSSSIGANGLAASAEQLELQGRSGRLENTDELFAQLTGKFDEVVAFLRQQIGV